MKIALLGYGRMGKEIEKLALQRGHEIVLKIFEKQEYDIRRADIAIDFSIPTAVFENICNCFEHKVPVISGTTGWLDQYEKAIEVCNKNKASFIYASNFSLGMNIFSELNKQLANMMKEWKNYKIGMEEIHHTKKLDAPSGTAITLAEGIMENTNYDDWELIPKQEIERNKIPIEAKRIPNVLGTHIIKYDSDIDTIEIKHTTHNRAGFALGALIAAEWIVGKTGVYTMKDVLNIG